jgi:hypothetical protein
MQITESQRFCSSQQSQVIFSWIIIYYLYICIYYMKDQYGYLNRTYHGVTLLLERFIVISHFISLFWSLNFLVGSRAAVAAAWPCHGRSANGRELDMAPHTCCSPCNTGNKVYSLQSTESTGSFSHFSHFSPIATLVFSSVWGAVFSWSWCRTEIATAKEAKDCGSWGNAGPIQHLAQLLGSV